MSLQNIVLIVNERCDLMKKVLDLDDYFVQRGIEELPGSLKKVLSRVVEDIASRAAEGRAPDDQWERAGDDLNVVPSKHKGDCKHLLVGVCYDKDNFENRIREWLDHASTTCQGINMELYFFTTQWNSFTVDKFNGYIASLRKNGTAISMIYVTEKGLVLMPV
jgi:hypothetical protein